MLNCSNSTIKTGLRCSVINYDTYQNRDTFPYHRFPLEEECCKKWAINTRSETLLKIIKESGIQSLRHLRICGRHFNDTMYNTSSRKPLVYNAIPTVIPVSNPPPQLKSRIIIVKTPIIYKSELENVYEGLYKFIMISILNKIYTITKNRTFLVIFSNYLRDNHNIHSLIAHNCWQDDVENFFSRMRSGGGNRDNLTAQELLAEYRKVTVDSFFTHVPWSNCNLDAGEFIAKLHQLQTIPNTPIPTIIYPEIIPFAIFPITNLLDNSIDST